MYDRGNMKITILTLFPELFEPFLATSIIGRAVRDGHITVTLKNIRDFATDAHKTVDDTPYGGGAGMVMKVEPIHRALAASIPTNNYSLPTRTVVLSAKGQQFTQAKAHEYTKCEHLVLICGRYEGIDQRVIDHLADEELSVGPYVLAGGEIPAMIVIEAVTRLLPGVLGNPDSLKEESFSPSPRVGEGGGEVNNKSYLIPNPSPILGDGKITEYPQYTKPAEYNGWNVPDVLLSGNHEEIRKWRHEK